MCTTTSTRMFPCLDQPEFRATVSLAVDRPAPGLTVLSNMPVLEEQGGRVTFHTTPAMPTYLVALVIGYYSAVHTR